MKLPSDSCKCDRRRAARRRRNYRSRRWSRRESTRPGRAGEMSSAATPAVAAFVVGFRGHIIFLTFGFFRMAQRSARAIEWLRLGWRHFDNRIDKFERILIRRFVVKIVSLVANRVTLATLHPMIVIIEYLLERPPINHGLIALKTFTLLPLERLDRNGTKLDSLNRPPRFRVALQNSNSVKAGVLERGDKLFFRKCAGNATAPKFRIVVQFLRNIFVAHDVADDGATAFLEHAKNFLEERSLRFGFHQIKHAIRNHHVDAI